MFSSLPTTISGKPLPQPPLSSKKPRPKKEKPPKPPPSAGFLHAANSILQSEEDLEKMRFDALLARSRTFVDTEDEEITTTADEDESAMNPPLRGRGAHHDAQGVNNGSQGLRTATANQANRLYCPALQIKCPAQLQLYKLQEQFRQRENWWRQEYLKLKKQCDRKLNEVKASTTNYARHFEGIETWQDPTLSELIERRRQMAELDLIIEKCAFYERLNTKRKFFFPWKDMSGAGANGLLRQIENLTRERDKLKKEWEEMKAELGKTKKELEITKMKLRRSEENHRFASEDAVCQRRAKIEFKKKLIWTEGRLELANLKIAELEKEVAYIRNRMRELTEQAIKLEKALKAEKQMTAELREKVFELENQVQILEQKLKHASAHTEYWRNKYNDLLKGKKKSMLANLAEKAKKSAWFGKECDFCGYAPIFRLKPCPQCGHLTEKNPGTVWKAGWLLRLPKSLRAWKSVFHYEEQKQTTSLFMVSQNLEKMMHGQLRTAEQVENAKRLLDSNQVSPEKVFLPASPEILVDPKTGRVEEKVPGSEKNEDFGLNDVGVTG
ncbi:unnamed protein product [Amoebophrya sp. A120]|nr:unnamed protein product [Amoebophrya sp. A120]|eukprot:GSA120T00008829001.1